MTQGEKIIRWKRTYIEIMCEVIWKHLEDLDPYPISSKHVIFQQSRTVKTSQHKLRTYLIQINMFIQKIVLTGLIKLKANHECSDTKKQKQTTRTERFQEKVCETVRHLLTKQ